MAKHLVDIDPDVLSEARAELRTSTIKDTIDEALRRVGTGRRRRLKRSLDVLARARLLDRDQAWR
jgi:Arc/MetJ family transcription regulator